MTSRLSDTRIRSATKRWANKVQSISKRLNNKKALINSLNRQISKIDNAINNPEYLNVKNKYENIVAQENDIKQKLAKTKSKGAKNRLNNQLTNLKAKAHPIYAKMKEIARKKGLSKEFAKRRRLRRNRNAINHLIASLKNQQKTANAKVAYYRKVLYERSSAYIRKRNEPIIAQRLKQAKGKGVTTLYRTDMQDATVFQLIETSPSETDSNDVATKPVDNGHGIETNVVSRNSMEYSATYYIQGDSFAQLDAEFHKLMDWSSLYEFTVSGFTRWNHAYITSIGKSTESGIAGNGMILNITFDYLRQAKIQYKKITKSKLKHKSGAKKSIGRSGGRRYIRVKPGMTYWQISKRMHVPIKKLEKMNRWHSRSIPVGSKVRYQ